MKKRIIFFTLFILILLLVGCQASKVKESDSIVKQAIPPKDEIIDEQVNKITSPNLTSEEAVREYIVGEWIFDKEYVSDRACRMIIDEDLKIKLSFSNLSKDDFKEDYQGQIFLDRMYAGQGDPPDIITIKLPGTEFSQSDFFFLHRTSYDSKHVMSIFYSGNGTSIFDVNLRDEESDYTLDELIFEKTCEYIPKIKASKNDKFYSVYWGKGENDNIWIDDVNWTPPTEGYLPGVYPYPMTLYENDIKESVLYNIKENRSRDILGDDLFPGQVYYVETDENANIVEFISAEYKRFLEVDEEYMKEYVEEDEEEYNDYDIDDQLYDIIKEIVEVQEYIDLGMTILIEGETTTIEEEECYIVILGTDHEESFVREIYYAIDINTQQVYRLDVINDKWLPLGVG